MAICIAFLMCLLQIYVKDSPTSICSCIADPHCLTMDRNPANMTAADILKNIGTVRNSYWYVSLFCPFRLKIDIKTKIRWYHMSRVMRKPTFCICTNKDVDHAADHRLCFLYIVQSLYFLNKKCQALAIFCGCSARFVSTPKRQVFSRLGLYVFF